MSDSDLNEMGHLIETLQMFFGYWPQEYAAWKKPVD